MELLIKNHPSLKEEARTPPQGGETIFCNGLKEGKFCPLKRKGKVLFLPIEKVVKNFTLFVVFEKVRFPCVWIFLKTFLGLKIGKIESSKGNLKITFGGKKARVKSYKRDFLVLRKEGFFISVETSRDNKFFQAKLKSFYLSKIEILPFCGKIYKLYFYKRALSREEINLLRLQF